MQDVRRDHNLDLELYLGDYHPCARCSGPWEQRQSGLSLSVFRRTGRRKNSIHVFCVGMSEDTILIPITLGMARLGAFAEPDLLLFPGHIPKQRLQRFLILMMQMMKSFWL